MNNVIKGGASGGPSYGITTAGVAGAVGTNENQFIGNKISDFYSYGFRLQNMNTALVSQNEILGRCVQLYPPFMGFMWQR